MSYFISVAEAKQLIKENIFKTEKIELPILEALGSYTSEPVVATMDVPSFDNSAMDGYGFTYDDLKINNRLKLTGEVPAGADPHFFRIKESETVRIFTGAKIPDGVDTVIMQEKVNNDGESISFDYSQINKGDNIRIQGSQTRKGELIISENTLINHAVIGFLAGFGIDKIKVYDKVKIGLLYTGNELVELGQPLPEGKIYNSNTYTLQAALAEIKHQFLFINHVKDTADATFSAIQEAMEKVDVLLITGGISVGDYDYVKSSLEKLGVDELFYKIKQKPGKPLFFGKLKQKYVFALPGNPASVFSCYHQYVKPFLLGCSGRKEFNEEEDWGILDASEKKKSSELTIFLKAEYHQGKVRILKGQESYKMNSVAEANCLVEFPEGITEMKTGEKVKVWKI
ncbi:molybdopterin molybdotransferase MoeA [Chryseobacterium sp.]|uniref:molybdopterin molybdotransferase MoeA n=1 Tax=Chryseobacterium sp. TaxID=1871047 RepID=UPI0025BDA361|nr:molybdopterin molybdotransferase MoeA [Chryseobacterium sp.]